MSNSMITIRKKRSLVKPIVLLQPIHSPFHSHIYLCGYDGEYVTIRECDNGGEYEWANGRPICREPRARANDVFAICNMLNEDYGADIKERPPKIDSNSAKKICFSLANLTKQPQAILLQPRGYRNDGKYWHGDSLFVSRPMELGAWAGQEQAKAHDAQKGGNNGK